MSTSPASVPSGTTPSTTNESETTSSFKKFWRSSDRSASQGNVTFIEQDPVAQAKGKGKSKNRLSSFFKSGGSSAGDDENSTESAKGAAQKRRQQVYQAQKRHRNRRAEYIQTLEAEVAKLQHQDAVANSEKTAIAQQNEAIRAFIASRPSLHLQLDALNMATVAASSIGHSSSSSASLDIRYDAEIGHERTFMDFGDLPDFNWTSASSTTDESQTTLPVRHGPVKGDSWAALDFILALEWPCQNHVHHPGINPDAKIPVACAQLGLHGHALTATAAVFQSAMPPSKGKHDHAKSSQAAEPNGLDPDTKEKWQLPHSEIDKLVQLSEQLLLDDEQMTPAQAYCAIRETVPSDGYLRPTLEALKVPLSSLTQCHGFGAVLPTDMFWQHLDGALQTLNLTRPDLVHADNDAVPQT